MINYFKLFELDYNRALAPYEMIFLKCDKKERLKRLYQAFRDFFYIELCLEIDELNKSSDFLFVKSMKRPDYDQLFQSISDTCPKSKIIADIYEAKSKFTLYNFLNAVQYIPLFLKVFRRDIVHWLFLCLSLSKIICQVKMLPYLNTQHIVVFADMQPLDNILVQFASMENIKSTTMQHGLYVDYVSYNNVNVVNYKNADASNFLAWGQDTAELILRYHPDKDVYLCGKPTLTHLGSFKSENYFTVIFDQNIFFSHNRSLLKLAYELSEIVSLKVNMRLHPNNRINWFNVQPEKTLVDQDIWCSRFVLGHTSSLLYECMRLGIPTFRYKTDIPSVTTPEQLQFSNIEELSNLIKNTSEIPFNAISKRYIVEIGQDSMNEYKKYFMECKVAFNLSNAV